MTIDLYLSERRVFDGAKIVAICDDWNYVPRTAETYTGLNTFRHVVEACAMPTHRIEVPAGSRPLPHSETTILVVPTGTGFATMDADDLVKAARLASIPGMGEPRPILAPPASPSPTRSISDGSNDHEVTRGLGQAPAHEDEGRVGLDGDEGGADRAGHPGTDDDEARSQKGEHGDGIEAGLPFRLACS
jgi:hypothetical protein